MISIIFSKHNVYLFLGFENGHSFNAPIWSVSVGSNIYLFFFIIFIKNINNFIILISLILLLIDKTKIFDTLFLESQDYFFQEQ